MVIAEVAEVSVEDGRIRVHVVTAAVDCGTAVNPLGIEAQVQGSIAFGLTAALHGKLTIEGGKVVESNFHDYPVLRMFEMPKITEFFLGLINPVRAERLTEMQTEINTAVSRYVAARAPGEEDEPPGDLEFEAASRRPEPKAAST